MKYFFFVCIKNAVGNNEQYIRMQSMVRLNFLLHSYHEYQNGTIGIKKGWGVLDLERELISKLMRTRMNFCFYH